MKVTIITPCYNSAPYIATTIESVQRQTLTDWEMIVVDDGSTDNSANIVSEIAAIDPRIRLIQKENGGSATARNLGLTHAQGEYIQFLDADDTIEHDKLQKQIEIMTQLRLDMSYTDFRMVNADGTIEKQLKGYNFNLFKMLAFWGVFGTIPPHAFIYRRTFLENNNIVFNEDIREREDWDFHIKTFSTKHKSKRLYNYCGAYYFRCPTGKTTNGSLTKVKYGTTKYLLYKIQQTTGYKKILLLLRLSIECIENICADIRRNLDFKVIWALFTASKRSKTIFAQIMLFTPLSIPIYVCRYIWTHSKQ